jgi:hypothetical protein
MVFLCQSWLFEPCHDETNIMGSRPAWIQISLRIRAVWSVSMLFAISFSTCYRVCKWWWPQTHYVGFVMARLICMINLSEIKVLLKFKLKRGQISQARDWLTCWASNLRIAGCVGSNPSERQAYVSSTKKLYTQCLVLAGSWYRFESILITL